MSVSALARTDNIERRRFGMHPKLLLDVIKRQAGTLAKAVLEGVMNSVDAKATKCSITVTPESVLIDDNGIGIAERKQIEDFFETFGQPHTEKEKKIYGTFRMGRGQMFSYGRNRWRTGPFEMNVNIADDGLDYDLKSGLPEKDGCRIEIKLYERMKPSDFAETERLIRSWAKYAQCVVVYNGTKINVDPAKEKWDFVTDEAYIRLTRGAGTLALYNLGVHTLDMAGSHFGVGGVIVSRQQLEVNFARNDVQSSCKVWRKIKPFVDQIAQKELLKRESMNDDERQRLIDLIAQDEVPAGAVDLKIITACSGRHYSIKQFFQCSYQYKERLTSAPLGDRRADKLFQQKLAFVVAEETLRKFNMSLSKFLDVMWKIRTGKESYRMNLGSSYKICSLQSLIKSISESYDLIAEKNLTALEGIWLKLAHVAYWLIIKRERNSWEKRRKLCIGRSPVAEGWTDGESYIAIGRDYLRRLQFDVDGVSSLVHLLAHEHCHDNADTGTHVHSMEFYEKFHDIFRSRGPAAVGQAMARLPVTVLYAKRALTKRMLRTADRDADTLSQLEAMVKILKEKRDAADQPEE